MRKGNSPNSRNGLDRGVSVPGTSNWIICSLLSQFCFSNFTTFSLLLWEANSYYPRRRIMRKGNSPNPRNGLDRKISVPEAFNLDHLQLVKPILFSKFYNFFTFILEANSYYPRGLIMKKGNSPNSRNGLDRGV